MRPAYKPSEFSGVYKSAIQTAYETLEYKEMREITKMADDLTAKTRLSFAQAIELLGKIGIKLVEA